VCQYVDMVCIYCGHDTKVSNSREQKRLNQVWRRRNCLSCGAIFTTVEAAARERAFVVKSQAKHPQPFSRDKLFISIYESLKHRSTALRDAAALTDTVIGKLLQTNVDGTILRADIVDLTSAILKRFDKAAAVHYAAYHLIKES
jgi:transcriptional repressor NrdR